MTCSRTSAAPSPPPPPEARRWLIDQGIADPSRLCIVGWSYGGYAALIGVVKEPQPYEEHSLWRPDMRRRADPRTS
jgi:prolyl oligopeptidase family protein